MTTRNADSGRGKAASKPRATRGAKANQEPQDGEVKVGPDSLVADVVRVENPNNDLMDHNYLKDEEFETVDQILQRNVATAIGMYLKFKKFHWDIRGRMFRDLHKMFDEMAEKVFATIDPLAERLVQLGGSPVAAPAHIERLSAARVPEGTTHDAREMLESLVADHDAICRALRDDSEAADEAGDPATADLLNAVIQDFDFNRWMLRATLDDRLLD